MVDGIGRVRVPRWRPAHRRYIEKFGEVDPSQPRQNPQIGEAGLPIARTIGPQSAPDDDRNSPTSGS